MVARARQLLADRLVRHGAERVAVGEGRSARRADDFVLQVGLDVRVVEGSIRKLLGLEGPGLGGAVNLAQVIDAGVLLRLRASAHEVGDGDRGQQADDGDDDHDFHQGEA